MGRSWRELERRVKRSALLEGFEPAVELYSALKAAELEEDVEAAKKEAFDHWRENTFKPVMEWAEQVYDDMSEAVGETTGMTLGDFLWLLGYAPVDG